jgi:uncharacterized membrane protein YeaQ/YmgE (transglycosylase-associated protein family)
MEMLFSIMSGVFVGWLAGRAMGYDEYGRIVTICFGGAGAIAVALAWTIMADRIVGTSASPQWIIAGLHRRCDWHRGLPRNFFRYRHARTARPASHRRATRHDASHRNASSLTLCYSISYGHRVLVLGGRFVFV